MRANASTIVLLLCLGLSLGASEGVRTLRVKLFPYIPGVTGSGAQLARVLAERFRRSPWGRARDKLQLEIDINPTDDPFKMETLKRLFTGREKWDVVEVDTLMLPRIVRNKWARAIEGFNSGDWLRTVPNAVRVGQQTYGVPTYICSNVVFSFERLSGVTDSTSLISALDRRGKPSKCLLSANLAGSWTLPSAYIDAFVDTHTISRLPAKLTSTRLDPDTMVALKRVVDACTSIEDGVVVNRALDGTYKGNTLAEQIFATGAAKGYMGYSEGLYDVLVEAHRRGLSADALLKNLQVIAAPLGGGDRPVINVDALVLNANMAEETVEGAQAFTMFLSSPEARQLLSFSEDTGGSGPFRYLMQARREFWELQAVKRDPVFAMLKKEVADKAQALPNTLFPNDEIRKALHRELLEKLRPSGDGEDRESDPRL